MNIELDEVVVMDISDEALELASNVAQRGPVSTPFSTQCNRGVQGC
jgi:hypothetical protein